MDTILFIKKDIIYSKCTAHLPWSLSQPLRDYINLPYIILCKCLFIIFWFFRIEEFKTLPSVTLRVVTTTHFFVFFWLFRFVISEILLLILGISTQTFQFVHNSSCMDQRPKKSCTCDSFLSSYSSDFPA